MKLHTTLAALLLASLCTSFAQQNISWNVELELQIVSMREELATPLVAELRDPQRVEAAFKRVQKLLAEKRATLVGWPILTTKNGLRAAFEQVDEIRYPTEFGLGGKTTTTEITEPPVTSGEPGDNKPESTQPKKTTTTLGASDGGPTAFETRNVGVTFEAEPVVAPDGEMIELNVSAQHVQLLEWTKMSLTNPPGVTVAVMQPRFAANKTWTSMTFRNGERKLIGFFKVQQPTGNVELFILRVEAVRRSITVEAPPTPSAPAPPAQ